MKKRIFATIMLAIFASLLSIELFAFDNSRGLWACKSSDGKSVFVNWRMRVSDSPKSTSYKVYTDNKLIATLTDKTNITLSSNYANSSFSLEVYNPEGELIDEQKDVKCTQYDYYPILLDHPTDYTMYDNTVVTYSPYDCSAYDMDNDGEQEIIVCWAANIGAEAKATAPPILDCYKLNGTKLWRINFGPNVLAGCRFTFLCYDFDGDGYGEIIAKTAQGTKDATGDFLSTGVAKNANHNASSINQYGVITDGGNEWITCFSGLTGKELATIDYWPYFNIQNNWDDRANKSDGNSYGHRGNWLKACVAFLDIDGEPKPCFVTNRGIYTYAYAAAYSWNGKNIINLWKYSSEKSGQGLYAQGAHSITCGDVDNDGFDEIIFGAAALDHDGSLLWRTGLGHGDATHLGEFDPTNEGMEYFMITEESTAEYDCALIDAKTGNVLTSINQTGGDTGRGLILDCDDNYDGAEFLIWSDENLRTCEGTPISAWHNGSTKSSSINFRIFWDGDLLEEYADRGHVDKWDSEYKSWGRIYNFGNNITIDGTKIEWGANTNNDSKYNPCLQADIIGDWREESIFWTTVNEKYYLTIYPSTISSDYKLPWLRDDHTYDMAIAWQNCGYNQPPHLGYSPIEYYKQLDDIQPALILSNDTELCNQSLNVGDSIKQISFSWQNAYSVIPTDLPKGITAKIDNRNKKITLQGIVNDSINEYHYKIKTIGGEPNFIFEGIITVNGSDYSDVKSNTSENNYSIYQDENNLYIKCHFVNYENVKWSIKSLLGETLLEGRFNNLGDGNCVISKKSILSGTYILSLYNGVEEYLEKIILN